MIYQWIATCNGHIFDNVCHDHGRSQFPAKVKKLDFEYLILDFFLDHPVGAGVK